MLNLKPTLLALAIGSTLGLGASGAMAAEITMRVADSFPTGHYIVENGTKPWMAKIKELTNGKVDFEYYPAQQLGKAKDMMAKGCNGFLQKPFQLATLSRKVREALS